MKRRMEIKGLALAILTLSAANGTAQVTALGNTIVGAQYVGCDGGSSQPLRLKTTLNYNIDFSSVNLLRMRLNGNPVVANINGYPGINRDGYFSISGVPAFYNSGPGAFSRLHLVDDEGPALPQTYAQQYGYRPWMRNGITFTGNSDQGYIGQQYMATDATDMVIQWSDNPQTDPWASDRMRFVFASNPIPASPTGMRSLNGLEAMRL